MPMPAKNKLKVKHVGEFGLISRISRVIGKTRNVIKGIGDDCAVLALNQKEYLLITTDMLSEGAHFERTMGADRIGSKAMASNVSDIAVMGGLPFAAVVSLGLPDQLDVGFVEDLYRGINHIAKTFNVNIVGGDTIASEMIVINIALLGRVEIPKIVYRSGARPGDMVFVTGTLGRSFPTQKHLDFTPRLAEARFLVEHFKPTAMIDISDGLAGDLGHIIKESGVGAAIEEKLIPKTPGASLENALHDGEDFELLFTMSPSSGKRLLSSKSQYSSLFCPIGVITKKKGQLLLVDSGGVTKTIFPKSFTHF